MGIIDAGTNSFLLLIAEKDGEAINYKLDTSKIVGLGRMKNGVAEPGIFETAEEVVSSYKRICDENGVDRCVMIGTEFFRNMEPSCFAGLSMKFDEAHIISGDEEAELSYRSVVEDEHFRDLKDPVVVDVGGGSVEFAMRNGTFKTESFPLGAHILTNRYVTGYPVGSQLEKASGFVERSMAELPEGRPLVSIGGTGTTLVGILDGKTFDATRVHGRFLTADEIEWLYGKLSSMSPDELSGLEGMERGREKIIAAGAFILLKAVEKVNGKGCRISVRGHRYSVAKDVLERKDDIR